MSPSVLLISGSLRAGSTNSAILRTLGAVAPDGLTTAAYDGMARLPHFSPDDDVEPLHPEVAALRSAIGAADALMICTPEYAGALPGSFKNLLDWTVGGMEMSGKPVGWVNASLGPTGGADAHSSLRKVLGYIRASVVERACLQLPVTRDQIDADGLIPDPAIRAALADALLAVAAVEA